MKKVLCVAALALAAVPVLACQPMGWIKDSDRAISMLERQCIYEKNGARVAISVSGMCPMHPC